VKDKDKEGREEFDKQDYGVPKEEGSHSEGGREGVREE